MVQKVNLGMTEGVSTEIDAVSDAVDTVASDLSTLNASLGTASTRDVGVGSTDVVETSQLDTRIGTSGNLGTAAQKNFGTADGNLPEYQSDVIELGGDFVAGQSIKIVKVGDLVTLRATSAFLDHTDGLTAPSSASGAIPAAYRPTSSDVTGLYAQDANAWASVTITTTGEFVIRNRDSSGLLDGRNTTILNPGITYVI